MRLARHLYLAPEGDEGAAGAPAPAPAPAVAAPAAAPAPVAATPAAPPAPAPAAAPAPSALAAAATEAEDDPAKPWAPAEKYKVLKPDGTIDVEATARKVDGARRNLEMRLGTGDVRPKTADDYTVTPPDELKDAFNADDPGLAEFRQAAHKAGFTQKQLDVALSAYFKQAPALVGGALALDQASATAELQKVWTTPEAYKQNAGAAFRAVQQVGGDLADQMLERYGNDPVFIQFAARIGAQLAEDRTPNNLQPRSGVNVDTLLADPAYSNPRDLRHATVTAQVNAYFASQPGASQPVG